MLLLLPAGRRGCGHNLGNGLHRRHSAHSLLAAHNLLVRVESVQWTDNIVDGEYSGAALLIPPLIASPEALLLARRQLQGLLEDERLAAVDELHSPARCGRVDGHAAFCGQRRGMGISGNVAGRIIRYVYRS